MKMAEIKNCDIGINILYQIFYSLVDLKLFSIEKEDEDFNPNEIWNSLTKEVLMVDSMNNTWPIGTNNFFFFFFLKKKKINK